MTNPPDPIAPVVLPEPPRRPGQADATPPVPRTRRAATPPPATSAGAWSDVLRPDETVLWEGRAEPKAQPSPKAARVVLLAIAAVAVGAALSAGSFIPLAFGLFAIHLMRKRQRPDESDRRYLLTDRAAYVAREGNGGLRDLRAWPITGSLRLGLGPRSVSFDTRYNAKGREEAEGFLDIADAPRVHAMIRDLQKNRP